MCYVLLSTQAAYRGDTTALLQGGAARVDDAPRALCFGAFITVYMNVLYLTYTLFPHHRILNRILPAFVVVLYIPTAAYFSRLPKRLLPADPTRHLFTRRGTTCAHLYTIRAAFLAVRSVTRTATKKKIPNPKVTARVDVVARRLPPPVFSAPPSCGCLPLPHLALRALL